MLSIYNSKSGTSETMYTYDEWVKEYYKRKIRRRIRPQTWDLYYIKQRLSGLIMVAIGIIAPLLLNGDATFTLVALPLGIFLMWTKERVMTF